MKIVFAIILIFHGVLHFLGIIKAFTFFEIPQLSQNFSKPEGLLWLAVALAFIVTGILFLLKNNLWFWIAIATVIVSQILIIINWQDAKFGSIANLIVLIVALLATASWNFQKQYKQDVSNYWNCECDYNFENLAMVFFWKLRD